MMTDNGQLTVPPGFRFHPTDEELLHYYLRKKVSYEPIDLDVIREVDLNRLEPWDIKEKCRIGSGEESEWYFFSHKDKKYPTGTRTNRATMAGFWKATGRDKSIHVSESSKKIGMRKTLVFYTGRAPHGHKTDWIMHEYRLDDQNTDQLQEEGWVVCRVFKKKNFSKAFQPESSQENSKKQKGSTSSGQLIGETTKHNQMQAMSHDYGFDTFLQLPQLFSPELVVGAPTINSSISLNTAMESTGYPQLFRSSQASERCGDWSFLDKLLASNGGIDRQSPCKVVPFHHGHGVDSTQNLLFQYLGAGSSCYETDVLNLPR